MVVDEIVMPSGCLADLAHRFRDYAGECVVVRIRRLTVLEIHVGVLSRATQIGMTWIHASAPEPGECVVIDHSGKSIIAYGLDCRCLIARAPPVKEVHHRYRSLYCREMSHCGKIHSLLHRSRGKKSETCRAARHDILMIAEDRERMCGERACAYMKHYRKQLAGDLEHVGNHQQQPLRCSECRGKRSCRSCPMRGASRTQLALHLLHLQRCTPHIEPAFHRPLVGSLAHRSDRGYGIYGGNLTKGVCHIRGGGASVGDHLAACRDIVFIGISHVWGINVRNAGRQHFVNRCHRPAHVILGLYQGKKIRNLSGRDR